MVVRVSTDKKFRRVHLKPIKVSRSWGRFSKNLLIVGFVFTLMVFSGYRIFGFVLRSSVFEIDQILVRGNERLSIGEVQLLVSDLRKKNIFLVDLDSGRQRLIASPWVKDATLRRILPSTIEVEVLERDPVGLGRLGERLYLIDDLGMIITEYGPNFVDFDLPIIDGLSIMSMGERPVVDEVRAALASQLLKEIGVGTDLAKRISQINVQDENDVVVMLSGDPVVIHLGTKQFLKRLESYLELVPSLRDHVSEIDHVDLRFGRRIYVRSVGTDYGSSAAELATPATKNSEIGASDR